jgi:hypothetical protein
MMQQQSASTARGMMQQQPLAELQAMRDGAEMAVTLHLQHYQMLATLEQQT